MAGAVSDEALARAVQQAGVVSYEQLEAAKTAQAESAAKGVLVSIADMLVQQGVMAPATRENIEKKVRAQQQGGIQQFGQFKLLKKLGEGGMGTVYLAEDTNAGRQVAIKLLPKKHAADADFLSRFRREARAAGQLNHVNIVGAHTVGVEMGHHYLVMEYVEGEPLDKILKREGVLPWDKALGIVMQAARGLKHAHEHGIIHRDIKPGNIILTPKGVAKILDLGLSKTIGGDERTFLTQTGVALGTPHYISPEQARGDKNIDGRTDIYSLGATFYHLVTGQTPFEGSTAAVIMLKHLNEQLPNPQDIVEDLPDGVAHVIVKMMAKETNDRYRDCKELLDDLELVIDGKTPSSQVIDVGKSSVAMRRVSLSPAGRGPTRAQRVRGEGAGRGVAPSPGAKAPPSPHKGEGHARRTAADEPELVPLDAPPNRKPLYIGAGVVGLALLVLIVALSLRGGGDKSGGQAVSIPSIPSTAEAEAAAKLKADEARLKNDAARLEDKRKAEEAKLEEERQKLAEDRRKLEEARLTAEARKKSETEKQPGTGLVPPSADSARSGAKPLSADSGTNGTAQAAKVAQPDTKAGETPAVRSAGVPPASVDADARANKAQQLFSAVLKETAPLLAQNKLSDAIALLERKANDPALADAAESLKQEKADVESVLELRKAAIEALRKQAGQQVTLRKGVTEFKGKVLNEPKPDVVTVDMGGAQMTFNAMQLSLEDVDQYAPKTGNAGADLRQRGIMYLAAGNVAKAKEYFTKPQTLSPETYLDRITANEVGETEAAALKAWERAEKLFAAKDMKGAKEAYEAFERDHGKTQTAGKQGPVMRERYDAIEKVLGPAPLLTLDLGGGVKMEMVLIKAGEFMMGSDDGEACEKPVHRVKISKPFYMGKYEVTVAQFRGFADATKYQSEAEKAGEAHTWKDGKWQNEKGTNWRTPGFSQEDNYPACVITWNDAKEFVKWAAKKTGRTVCLPTEAQWEYACRAGTTTKFNTGNKVSDLEKAAWFEGNADHRTHPVGQKKPNAWGLYDMHGNVWEWVQDYFNDEYYAESPPVDPKGPASGGARVLRGGSWFDYPDDCRAAPRNRHSPGDRSTNNGFRFVLDF